ncbi:MAG: serine/threonine-protein kinase [Planctomycetaceae bacterium]
MARPTEPADPSDSARTTTTAIPVTEDGTRRIGKYEIQKEIGSGGMGTVYLALDPVLKRAVALKVLPKDKAGNPTLVKRFHFEAQAAANLRHENIVTVYEAGQADGYLYIALEYVDGTDVANLVLKRGPMPVKRSVEIIRQVAQALDHANRQQVVHRDIKPGNLLIRRDGVVKLADLGLARIVDEHDDTSITRAGTTVGTVDYMSPEQARNSKAADVRSDIYSLGCTWYYMLTGKPPFAEGSLTNKLRAHAESPLPDPRSENPAVSEAVYAVMRRMAAKEPGQRYQTPGELIVDLDTTNFADDMVSQLILDDVEEPSKRSKNKPGRGRGDDKARNEGGGGARHKPSRAVSAAPREARWRPPREGEGRPESDLVRTIAFYSVVGILVAAVVAGIVALVNQYDASVDPVETRPQANQFNLPQEQTTTIAGSPVGNVQPGTTVANTTTKQADPQTTIPSGQEGRFSGGEPTLGAAPTVTFGGDQKGQVSVPTAADSARRFDRENSLLPDWTRAEPAAATLPVLKVRRQPASGEFRTLNAALERVEAPGAVVVLEGPGPFRLQPIRLADKGLLVIQVSAPAGAAQPPPLVVLAPPEDASHRVVELVNTHVELVNVHLGLDAGRVTVNADESLFTIDGGTFTLRHGSITVRGAETSRLSAIRLVGRSEPTGRSARVLIDGAVIRGNRLTALDLESPSAEVVVRRSLMWAGNAPAIRLAGRTENGAPHRTLHVVSSTLCSRSAAVEFTGNSSPPIATTCDWSSSLAAVPAGALAEQKSALVRLQGFSQAQARSFLGEAFAWKSMATLYTGWKSLVTVEPGQVSLAVTPSEWNALWKETSTIDAAQFQPELWPAHPVANAESLSLERVAPESIGRQYFKVPEGGWPGCAPEFLALADLGQLDVAQGGELRPARPIGISDGPASNTIQVDLAREDLGKALASKPLRPGTLVVAYGSGPKTTSPVVIRDTAIRLRLDQRDGAPLTLSLRSDGAKDGDGGPDALIAVHNGGLSIEGAAITASRSDRQPKWLIRVVDGDLALRRCRLQTPLVGATRSQGLIQWVRNEERARPRNFEGPLPGYLVCDGCFLAGGGSLIEADLRQRALFLRNTVAVSLGNVLAVNLGGVESQIAGAVDLETCTLSACGSFLDVTAAGLTAPTDAPLAVFADRCVFAPPLRVGQKSGPTFLSSRGPLFETRQLAWWENRCGYSTDFETFVRGDGEVGGPQNFESAWRARWPSPQVIDPLTGPHGVVLRTPLPQRAEDRAKLEPDGFLLHPTCQAATWDGGQQAIGAPIDELNLSDHRPAPSPAGKGKASKPAPSQPARPAF